MMRPFALVAIILFVILSSAVSLVAQVVLPRYDSFFLARKKGLLGKLGKSISISGDYIEPIKTVDPYKKYHGKVM